MADMTGLARQGWRRLARTAAYVLMPKFTAGAVVVARDDGFGTAGSTGSTGSTGSVGSTGSTGSTDSESAGPAPDRGPRVLLVRKRTGGGLWGFPAGYVGYGDSIVEAAHKELSQETGLTASITTENHLRTYKQPWAMHLDNVFLVAAHGEPEVRDALEITAARWWPVGDLPPLTRESELALTQTPGLLTRPIPNVAVPVR